MFEDEKVFLKEQLLQELTNLTINIQNVEKRLAKGKLPTPYSFSHIANRVDKFINQLEILERLTNGS